MIDLFVNDSDHSADYEAAEYHTITNKLSEHAVVLGDNSHCTDKLLEFSLKANRRFVFFHSMFKFLGVAQHSDTISTNELV